MTLDISSDDPNNTSIHDADIHCTTFHCLHPLQPVPYIHPKFCSLTSSGHLPPPPWRLLRTWPFSLCLYKNHNSPRDLITTVVYLSISLSKHNWSGEPKDWEQCATYLLRKSVPIKRRSFLFTMFAGLFRFCLYSIAVTVYIGDIVRVPFTAFKLTIAKLIFFWLVYLW